MSELYQVMERFRRATATIRERLEEAESRPTREEIEKILEQRNLDLAELETLKAKLEQLEKGE